MYVLLLFISEGAREREKNQSDIYFLRRSIGAVWHFIMTYIHHTTHLSILFLLTPVQPSLSCSVDLSANPSQLSTIFFFVTRSISCITGC